MKKRLFTSVLSVLLLAIVSVFGVFGCSPKQPEVQKTISLSETTKQLTEGESFTLIATTTPADAEVEWSSEAPEVATVENGTVVAVAEGVTVITAKNGTAAATCTVTVTAAQEQKFTVTFKNGETVLYTKSDVAEGATVAAYASALNPTKPDTTEKTYTFIGWATKANATADDIVDLSTYQITKEETFYAVYSETARKYTVNWVIDGVSDSKQVEYGTVPEYGVTPRKDSTAEWDYEFKGWAASENGDVLQTLPEVSGEATYYAVFEESKREYEITWVVEGASTTDKFEYGATPVYDGTPTKAPSEAYEYDFDGWSLTENGAVLPELPPVTGIATYYAVFKQGKAIIPEFDGGAILYSTRDSMIFMPNGLLDGGKTITAAVGLEDEVDYLSGAWTGLALDNAEINANNVRKTVLKLTFSDGSICSIQALSYAGVIDELSDFEAFFNEPAVGTPSNVYGYYVVIKDLGTANGSNIITLSQTQDEDHSFNGVLDGQGHTIYVELKGRGGLVGLTVGTATVKDLRAFFKDNTDLDAKQSGYGLFGRRVLSSFTVDNCYIEMLNEKGGRTTFGLMDYPDNKLVLTNTVVYGYTTPRVNDYQGDNSAKNAPSASSYNAFVIHARTGADGWSMATNFTKVFADNEADGAREVALSEITDASTFNKYWSKENDKLTWKGATNSVVYTPQSAGLKLDDILYSTLDSQIFLPASLGSSLEGVTLSSKDGATVYDNARLSEVFALSSAQINANAIGTTEVKVEKDGNVYFATVKSYAGVIDELNDFKTFFDNDPSQKPPAVLGYYIVIKDLGTGSEELALTQSQMDFAPSEGFNGILDGQGHSLNFVLKSGGLVGLMIGSGTVKNLSITFKDDTTTKYGIFGYRAKGSPVIENCYIEQTNETYGNSSTFGLMSRPEGKLVLRNVLVYGYNFKNDNVANGADYARISENSTNAYVTSRRADAVNKNALQNFTAHWDEHNRRYMPLDRAVTAGTVSTDGFNEYWSISATQLAWKGAGNSVIYTAVSVAA